MIKSLSALTAAFFTLATVLRWFVPKNLRVPGGWPLGSHWYRADSLPFWLCFTAAIVSSVMLLVAFHNRHHR